MRTLLLDQIHTSVCVSLRGFLRCAQECGGKNISFTTSEMRCLYNRWSKTALLVAPSAVKDMWSGTIVRNRGGYKEQRKRAIVFAWIRDQIFRDKLFQLAEFVSQTLNVTRQLVWLSRKQARMSFIMFQNIVSPNVVSAKTAGTESV